MKKRSIFYIVLTVVIGVSVGLAYNAVSTTKVITLTCWDRLDCRTEFHGTPISCSEDSECDTTVVANLERMDSTCGPCGSVLLTEDRLRNFCGDDGYCKESYRSN